MSGTTNIALPNEDVMIDGASTWDIGRVQQSSSFVGNTDAGEAFPQNSYEYEPLKPKDVALSIVSSSRAWVGENPKATPAMRTRTSSASSFTEVFGI